jgi:hypothetical protein
VDLVMCIDPAEKLFGKDKMEKYIMRKAFDSEEVCDFSDVLLFFVFASDLTR